MNYPTFGFSAEELQSLGLLIVYCAILENQVDDVLMSFRAEATKAGPTKGLAGETLSAKLQEIKIASRSETDQEIVHLVKELRWAMAHVQKARNMLAHGRVLQDENGAPSFWSHWKLKEMTVPEVTGVMPRLIYAGKVTRHIHWKLMNRSNGGIFPMTPLPPLPGRPA
ncbi:hypothetical protein HZZ13_06185 [Bradyrhizobium sp. CNPSo 4010]|uniref:Apea-like HEPN domain-containing protein n=1 Tax=Bradyrhizobium agreste TaxID=2751811 RepID=A0ABS0PJK5_9BRAD|nr:hypothetical protein [Bradyrhizobium agreste]MBH5397379.1 hypothetical protein [Bradyrhizobium agreste]